MHSTLTTKNHQSKWFVINLTGLEVGTFICNTTGNPLKCSLFSAWPRRFLFISFVCQFLKYKCLRHVYIVSMLNIVKKLFIYGFNLFNISKILENIYIYIYNVLFYKVLHDSWGAWKIYSPKNISLKNNSKNDFPKKKLFPSDCVNGKYYLLEWMHRRCKTCKIYMFQCM